jgi:predicted Zn-dependent protease
VERDQFNTLLSKYTSLTGEDAQNLIALQQSFPYSQVIRSLAARAAQDNSLKEKEQHLHLSAIYSTDRAVLKSVMTGAITFPERIPKKENKKITKQEPIHLVEPSKKPTPDQSASRIIKIASPTQENQSGDDLYNEVMHDIEILKQRKLQFEQAFENLSINHSEVELTSQKLKKGKIHADPEEEFIKEIKTTKKKIKPEGSKQKEQIEIIDQFIKTQPTISKNKLTAAVSSEAKEDLIEKNLTYGENIVSETLVQILLKQGKKEKAIEVLKKLIWKFPQKKAYFAAQIEDLKK